MQLPNQSPFLRQRGFGLPSSIPQSPAPVKADGGMEFLNVLPGSYILQVIFSGVTPTNKSIIVADQPVDGLELSIPIGLFSGRILMEDGSTVPILRPLVKLF